jgi:hypothetical protein
MDTDTTICWAFIEISELLKRFERDEHPRGDLVRLVHALRWSLWSRKECRASDAVRELEVLLQDPAIPRAELVLRLRGQLETAQTLHDTEIGCKNVQLCSSSVPPAEENTTVVPGSADGHKARRLHLSLYPSCGDE